MINIATAKEYQHNSYGETFVRKSVRENTPPTAKTNVLDKASSDLSASVKNETPSPENLLGNVVEASSRIEGTIDSAHDFNLARVLELLSDPLLMEDIPDE